MTFLNDFDKEKEKNFEDIFKRCKSPKGFRSKKNFLKSFLLFRKNTLKSLVTTAIAVSSSFLTSTVIPGYKPLNWIVSTIAGFNLGSIPIMGTMLGAAIAVDSYRVYKTNKKIHDEIKKEFNNQIDYNKAKELDLDYLAKAEDIECNKMPKEIDLEKKHLEDTSERDFDLKLGKKYLKKEEDENYDFVLKCINQLPYVFKPFDITIHGVLNVSYSLAHSYGVLQAMAKNTGKSLSALTKEDMVPQYTFDVQKTLELRYNALKKVDDFDCKCRFSYDALKRVIECGARHGMINTIRKIQDKIEAEDLLDITISLEKLNTILKDFDDLDSKFNVREIERNEELYKKSIFKEYKLLLKHLNINKKTQKETSLNDKIDSSIREIINNVNDNTTIIVDDDLEVRQSFVLACSQLKKTIDARIKENENFYKMKTFSIYEEFNFSALREDTEKEIKLRDALNKTLDNITKRENNNTLINVDDNLFIRQGFFDACDQVKTTAEEKTKIEEYEDVNERDMTTMQESFSNKEIEKNEELYKRKIFGKYEEFNFLAQREDTENEIELRKALSTTLAMRTKSENDNTLVDMDNNLVVRQGFINACRRVKKTMDGENTNSYTSHRNKNRQRTNNDYERM